MSRKPRATINKCATCRYFQKYLIQDAYGDKYQAARCTNPKSQREKVKGAQGACRCWAKKNLPTSGDYCYFIQDRIVYSSKTPKTKLPCYNCNARCRFSFNKKDRDFTQRKKRPILMEDLESK